jgi:hypothetical protein
LMSRLSTVGTTCLDTPYLSLSQPRWLPLPPSVRAFQ